MDRGIDTRSPISKKSMQPRMLLLFRVYVWGMCVCLMIFLFLNSAYARVFRVEEIHIQGNSIVPTEVLRAYVAEKIYDEKNLFPKNSSITARRWQLEKDIVDMWKSIETAEVRINTHVLSVFVKEYESVYAYCDTAICVGVTRDGKATTPILGKNTFVPFYGSIEDFTNRGYERAYTLPQFGSHIFDEESWNSIIQTVDVLQKNNIQVQSVALRPFHFFTIIGTYGASENIEFRFRVDKNHSAHVDNLVLAWNEGLRARAESEQLEYVISTIPEKVVYKFK